MTNQSDLQQSIRDITGTALDYNGDWSALFDLDGIAAGDWNGRLLAWINLQLGTSYAGLTEAQNAYAVENGAANWSALSTGVVRTVFSRADAAVTVYRVAPPRPLTVSRSGTGEVVVT